MWPGRREEGRAGQRRPAEGPPPPRPRRAEDAQGRGGDLDSGELQRSPPRLGAVRRTRTIKITVLTDILSPYRLWALHKALDNR